jgi:16S rRNA processing protein RimM
MNLFEAGEIVKTRGLHGCLKILCYVERTSTFTKFKFIYIEQNSGQKNRFNLKKIDLSGKTLFVEVEGISDVESAQELIGCKVFLPQDVLEKLPEGEYYWRDVIGLAVYTEDNKYIGRIESVFPTGSNDVYVCKGEDREILLPAISEVIRKIDIDHQFMTVNLLEGL